MLLENPEDVKHETHQALPSLDGGVVLFKLLATLSNNQQAVNCVRWAGQGLYLASGSDDRLVLLYELHTSAPSPVLFGSNAKLNKQNWYPSSAGEAKTFRMLKAADWQEADIVTEPFEGCASKSQFRRLSWSPDGSILCATHAFSSKKNIAALLNRGSWANDLNLLVAEELLPVLVLTQNS
ncbi:hypothetical protein PsorP6_014180 [Peronosclerospora sorghi]|uniref:Uncharacterized protein n=1 Tax=Peronosclerospora sorghi TaxID=230839 RepID=A0ACC0VFK3_9STRA|nr:hypothetical protein PsorP6_014180 [Peronosclerospora sorghi]